MSAKSPFEDNEKMRGGFSLPAPPAAEFFEKAVFAAQNGLFPKKKSLLNLTGQKMGQTATDVLKIQQAVNMREKIGQFLILSDNTARSKISTCPIHVSKNQPCRFFGGVGIFRRFRRESSR